MRTQTRTPHAASLVSISLVLFFLGMFATIALSLRTVLEWQKEELELKAILVYGTDEARADKLLKRIGQQDFCKDIRFVSAEQAFKDIKATDPQLVEVMDSINPFPASLNLHLNAAYIRTDSVESIAKALMLNPEVAEVYYPIAQIDQVNRNANLITQLSVVIGIILLGIAYLLIVNTVKLAIFSKRFLIRTMQLIGATQSYIRKPFIRMGLLQGFVGGVVANLLLVGMLLIFHHFVLPIDPILQSLSMKVLYLGLIIFGTLLGWFSSTRAVNKFLDKSLDQLA